MSNIANLGNFPHTIGNLDDRPNLPAAQMKAKFEADVMALWAKLAEAIPDINSALPASKLVDVVNSSSTDNGVPTAKAVYDAIADASLGGSVQQIIDDWLDAHPEATTTVTDGSITNAKLASTFVTPGVASDYVSNTSYPAGSYVFHGGALYTNPEDVSDSVWTAAHWVSVALGNDVTDLKSAVDDLCSFGELNLANVDENSFTLIKGTKRTQNIRFPAIDPGKYILSYDITDSSDNDIKYSIDVYYGENPSAVQQTTINESVSSEGRYAETFTASDGITRLYFYILSNQSNDAEITIENIKIQKFDDKYNNTDFVPYQFAVDYGARESILRQKHNIITPEDFGAVGDGDTDDTTAVQAAIDAAIDGHKNLFFNQYAIYAVGGIVISDGTLSIDFNGCTLKGLTSDPVIDINPDSYISSNPNGYIKNVNIDMNNIAAYGIKVTHIWRKILDTIAINNPPANGIGLYVYGQSSCAGNLFSKFRGKGSSNTGTIFIKTDAGDNTFDNCDFVNYQIGAVINYFSVFSNFHGYISHTALYSDSVFVDISAPSQMTNMYPDTQHIAFNSHSNDSAVVINGLVLVFNSTLIPASITENKPPYIFAGDNGACLKKWIVNGMSVNSTIYNNFSIIYGAATNMGVNVASFTVNANNSDYDIARPGITPTSFNSSISYKSGLKNGTPVLYQEGYKDQWTVSNDISANTEILSWTVYKSFVPYPGVYPAVKNDGNGGYETINIIVEFDSINNEYVVKTNTALAQNEIVSVNIPVMQRATSYTR